MMRRNLLEQWFRYYNIKLVSNLLCQTQCIQTISQCAMVSLTNNVSMRFLRDLNFKSGSLKRIMMDIPNWFLR